MTTPKPKPSKPSAMHAIHVTEKHGAHLHYNSTVSTSEVTRAGIAARAFLGPDRQAPAGFEPGFYPFRVDTDGNGYPGRRVEGVEPA